ncbi:MAG: eS25 family ribosomal protein [Candidatus Odinarchaeia archaeon]
MPKKVKVKQKVQAKKKGAGTEKIEKNIRSIELKPEIEETLRKEVPKMDVITPNQIASKYNIRLSLAKKALKYLSESGLIKPVATSRRIKIYTNVAAE